MAEKTSSKRSRRRSPSAKSAKKKVKKATRKKAVKKKAGAKKPSKKKAARKKAAKKKTARKTNNKTNNKSNSKSNNKANKTSKTEARSKSNNKSNNKTNNKTTNTNHRAASQSGNHSGKKNSNSKRGPGRPPGGDSKRRGSQTSRRQIRLIARRILEEAEGMTREEASARIGAHADDIKNLKAGNLPSIKLFLRVVRDGRYDPDVLIQKSDLRKLPSAVSTRGARASLISARIRKLAKNHDASELARKTGLSIYTIYQHRVADKRVGLHTILAFIDAGAATPRSIFLGKH